MNRAVHGAVDEAARHAYGRLIAYIAARSGDVAGAEDALGDAFVAALERWPVDGVPDNPTAWLLHAARNRIIDAARRRQVRENAAASLEQLARQPPSGSAEPFPDERLALLFVCAHPAIDPAARTPLMLQTVLGVEAARIASAFLVSPAAMGQRLVRAKTKIRDAAIPFRIPEPPEWAERVTFVLDAIYSAYTAGAERPAESGECDDLAAEALSLARLVVGLLPAEPEAHGLAALLLHVEARRAARLDPAGRFVPLDHQDPALWSAPQIAEAERHLRTAASLGRPGRYQWEAAIQSIHADRAVTGRIDWPEIALLYEGLIRTSGSIGSRVGRAVALAEAGDPAAAAAALAEIAPERVAAYAPYWAARGHLAERQGLPGEAEGAFRRAASLTAAPAWKEYLTGRAEALGRRP